MFSPYLPDDYMKIALRMARRHIGRTLDNPSVGCVIVKNNQIIGQGVTDIGGRPHAEVSALEMAGPAAKDSDIYVTLEPCAHIGRTGACAEALINAKVKKVYIAALDPDPRVSGKGIEKLNNAGIKTDIGLRHTDAEYLHRGFFSRVVKGRPFITLKSAMSLDGKIAYPDNINLKKITCDQAHLVAHRLRLEYDAIAIGVGTLMADRPRLDCRLVGLDEYSPHIIVFDHYLRGDISCLSRHKGKNIFIFHAATQETPKDNRDNDIIYAPFADDLTAAIECLAQYGVNMLLIEGGQNLITSFIQENIYDDIVLLEGNHIIGAKGKDSFGDITPLKMSLKETQNHCRFFAPLDK